MLLTAIATPQRVARNFQHNTILSLQVITATGTLHIGSEMGEVANPSGTSDGLRYFQSNTGGAAGTTVPPPQLQWKGEFWYSSDQVGGVQFILIVLSEIEAFVSHRAPGDVLGARITETGRNADRLQWSGLPGKKTDANLLKI